MPSIKREISVGVHTSSYTWKSLPRWLDESLLCEWIRNVIFYRRKRSLRLALPSAICHCSSSFLIISHLRTPDCLRLHQPHPPAFHYLWRKRPSSAPSCLSLRPAAGWILRDGENEKIKFFQLTWRPSYVCRWSRHLEFDSESEPCHIKTRISLALLRRLM